MTNRKKLLVLTPRFPYPMIGGDRRRIYTVCKALSQHFDLTLLSLVESREELELAIPDDGVYHRIERILLPKWRSRINVLVALLTGRSLQVAYYESARFSRRVEQLASEHDLVFAHLIRTGAYVAELSVTKILEMTDAISLNYQRLVALDARRFDLKNLIYRIERKRILREELRLAARFDHTFLVSEVDRSYLLNIVPSLSASVSVAPLGIDVDALEVIPQNHSPSTSVAFVGNMLTTQNLDAAEWFASKVIPILHERGIHCVFKVIGLIDERSRKTLERYAGVEVVGRVESIRDALKGSFAAVCPMRFGAGVQTKVLEYMAYGLPVIATPMGNEGIDAPSEAILVADSPSEFADKAERLYADENLRRTLAVAARIFVKSKYDSAVVSRPIIEKTFQII